MTLDKTFSHTEYEKKLYAEQEAAGLYKAGANAKPGAEAFCIMIPPPNVTGSLHIGHALNNTLQDILVRRKRQEGYNVLWQAGCDHAGIATQSLVEKQLAVKGVRAGDLPREELIAKIWEWKEESGGTIMRQLRSLGATFDGSRERFTMDEGFTKAVTEAFVSLHEKGLIYRAKRLVNWDCSLQTAISDLEAVPTETNGHFWHFNYAIEDSDETLTIATTRPETMFGDTAVAVNPKDERYAHLIGKNAILPITGRKIPIIGDDYADPETGTGAVKITPAHDFNDFEVGKRHDLPLINILNPDGALNDEVPAEYRGLDRFAARKKLIAETEASGALVKTEKHKHSVPHGDRSGTVIEPYLTDQWYAEMTGLAEKAVDAVKAGETRFVPENQTKIFFQWLENIQPWCLSRQLKWGHQIPAWHAPDGKIFVARTETEAQKQADAHYGSATALIRDPDVLDTWFSSGLWAFGTLGWPTQTEELKKYYPSSVLITGFDIVFFWVARMMMLSTHFTGEVPFRDVYVHALVRDEKGQKMSKSKGNVIDPTGLIEKFGADALRFTLAAMSAQGRDLKLSEQRIEGYRNFHTKLWNAVRFSQMNGCVFDPSFDPASVKSPLSAFILSKLTEAGALVAKSLSNYRFNDAATALYRFIRNEFCDQFVEMTKPILQDENMTAEKAEIRNVTAFVLAEACVLLHPFSPFITEALAEALRKDTNGVYKPLIHTAPQDLSALSINKEGAGEMELIAGLIDEIRSLRSELSVPASAKIPLVILGTGDKTSEILTKHSEIITRMARLSEISRADTAPAGSALISRPDFSAALPLSEFIDTEKEKKRLEGELRKLTADIENAKSRLANDNFRAKADPSVIEETEERLTENEAVYRKIEFILKNI